MCSSSNTTPCSATERTFSSFAMATARRMSRRAARLRFGRSIRFSDGVTRAWELTRARIVLKPLQDLSTEAINIQHIATFRRRSRHMLSQHLGGRSVNIHMLAKIPSPALKTPQKWRLKPTEPAPTCAQTSRNHVPHPFGRSRSSLSLAEEPAAGRRRKNGQHVNILSTFRPEVVNMQHPHFGRSKSIFTQFLNMTVCAPAPHSDSPGVWFGVPSNLGT